MDKRSYQETIQKALDTTLSGLQDDSWLARRLIAEAKGTKKVKKKISVGLIIVLALVLSTVTVLAVGALTGLFRLEQKDVGAMRSCVSTGDELYFMSSSGIIRWTPDAEEPETLISIDELNELGISFESLLYLEGDSIGLLDVINKKIWQYQSHEWMLRLDYEGTEMDTLHLRFEGVICQNEDLFILVRPSDEAAGKAMLYCANLQTGEIEHLLTAEENVKELCAYEPGKLLILVSYADQKEESILMLDTATGTVCETLYTAPIQQIQGLAYNKNYGGLYAMVGGMLSHWNGAEWIQLNTAAHSFLAQSFAVVGEGYVSISFDEMQYLPFSSKSDDASLTIRGMMAIDNADADFQQINGITVIRHRDPAMTSRDVRKLIESGDTTDLFLLQMDADTTNLIRDGLIAPLGSSEILSVDVREMIQIMQDAMLYHDTPYAVAYLLNPLVWQAAGTIPETYGELLSSIGNTEDRGFVIAYENGPAWTKEQYADDLLKAFIAESVREGGEPDFHTELFATALGTLKDSVLPSKSNAAEVINPSRIIDLGGDFPADLPEYGERHYDLDIEYPDEPQWQLPPKVTEEGKPSVPARLTVYVLNVNAEHPDAALAYLDYIATHRDPGDEGLMKPDKAKPVLHPALQRELDQAIETLQETGAGVWADEVSLQTYEARLHATPDSWAITENRLNMYRNIILPSLDLRLHPLLSTSAKQNGGAYDLLLEAMLSYFQDNTTLDECLDSLQRIWEEYAHM